MRPIVDITNKKYGLLTAKKKLYIDKELVWECECECGNIVYRSYRELHYGEKNNAIQSCGCSNITINGEVHSLVGNQFGKIFVKSYNMKSFLYTCIDKNGKIYLLSSNNLRKRIATSKKIFIKQKENEKKAKELNCLSYEDYIQKRKHLIHVFNSMRDRCYIKASKSYIHYGGRGIFICDEWLNNREDFINWSLLNGYNLGLEIDRIENNNGYSPDNCRWVDRKINANNKRSNLYITYNGKTQTLKQWCEELSLPYRKTHKRIYSLDWNVEKAFTAQSKNNLHRNQNCQTNHK